MENRTIHVLLVFILIVSVSLPGRGAIPEPLRGDRSADRSGFGYLPGQNPQDVVISTGTDRSRQIGMDMLNRGGTAMDAALACALARIVEDMGRIVSFAGIFMMVYYEASSGKTYSLNACFKNTLEETDPLSIPSAGIPNPRSVLVPGFMAGVQAAHDRFGRLSRAEVFAPAIDLAENGFTLDGGMIWAIRDNWSVLGVLPETRSIFLKKPYGLFNGYEAGDIFRQPELAETLRRVSLQGASYMYTGEWGRKLVEVIRSLGGRLSHLDMETYEVVWAEPNKTTYNGYEIHMLGSPSLGAIKVILGINLMDCSGLARLPHCSGSAEALYRLIYSSRVGEFFDAAYTPEIIGEYIPEGDFRYEALGDKRNAELIWAKIESGEWSAIEMDIARNGNNSPSHSEAIIAADREGNVVAVCHTINAVRWGNTGIFIDGVSIPGPAYHQKARMDKAGPGGYVADTTNPGLVLRNGRPVVASSCVGSDLHCNTIQNLYNMLTFGMSPEESRGTPKFTIPDWEGGTPSHKVIENAFDPSIIDAVRNMGLGITLVSSGICRYCWIGLLLGH